MSRSNGRLRLSERVESKSERSGATRTGEAKGRERGLGRGVARRGRDVAGRTEVI